MPCGTVRRAEILVASLALLVSTASEAAAAEDLFVLDVRGEVTLAEGARVKTYTHLSMDDTVYVEQGAKLVLYASCGRLEVEGAAKRRVSDLLAACGGSERAADEDLGLAQIIPLLVEWLAGCDDVHDLGVRGELGLALPAVEPPSGSIAPLLLDGPLPVWVHPSLFAQGDELLVRTSSRETPLAAGEHAKAWSVPEDALRTPGAELFIRRGDGRETALSRWTFPSEAEQLELRSTLATIDELYGTRPSAEHTLLRLAAFVHAGCYAQAEAEAQAWEAMTRRDASLTPLPLLPWRLLAVSVQALWREASAQVWKPMRPESELPTGAILRIAPVLSDAAGVSLYNRSAAASWAIIPGSETALGPGRRQDGVELVVEGTPGEESILVWASLSSSAPVWSAVDAPFWAASGTRVSQGWGSVGVRLDYRHVRSDSEE